MTEQDLKKAFGENQPRLPQNYALKHDGLLKQLTTEKTVQIISRKIVLRLALVLSVLALSLTAFALTGGFDLLNILMIREANRYPVSEEAQQLVQTDLADFRFEHTLVSVKEAVYDGQLLRVLYSIRDMSATAPFAEAGTILDDFTFEAADKDGLSWALLDYALIDGQSVNPIGTGGPVAGVGNGEVLTLAQFDLRELDLPDRFTVLLPIAGQNTPKELSFTLSSDNLPGVYALPLPAPVTFGINTLTITNLTWSPIRVYIDAFIEVVPGVPEEVCHEILWRWTLDARLQGGLEQADYPLADTATGYSSNTEFAPELGDFRHRILDTTKPVFISLHLEFASPGQMPDSLILRAGEDSVSIPTQIGAR